MYGVLQKELIKKKTKKKKQFKPATTKNNHSKYSPSERFQSKWKLNSSNANKERKKKYSLFRFSFYSKKKKN